METLFSPREVAQMLGVCEKTIYRATWRGDLEAHRAGKQLRFTRPMLEAWMSQNATTARKMPRQGVQSA